MILEAEILVDISYSPWKDTFPEVEQFVKVITIDTLNFLDVKGYVEIGVMLTSNNEVKKYNLRYRGIRSPTNILSFSQEEVNIFPGLIPKYLGDLVLGYQIIMKESFEQNKLLTAHLAHLLVHGVLHLLGYDHAKNNEASLMEKKETEILKILGFSDPYEFSKNVNC